MKINKKYSEIIEWIIAIILIVICIKFSVFSYGSFSPMAAHEKSERTFHYGPSKIIKSVELDGAKIYLCRYKDWFSASTVEKRIIMWYAGSGAGGTEIDYSKQVSYSWNGSSIKDNFIMKIYGYVNDPKISTILIADENKENVSKYVLDESEMFIFHWNENDNKNKIKYLKGLDKEGNIIYEEEISGL